MEGTPRKDIKERQRLGEYEEVLSEYASRYREMLHLGDRYMASNFFEEMFGTAVRILNERQPGLSVAAKLKEIRGRLSEAVTRAGANDEFMDEFQRNFDLCAIKLVPRRMRGEERQPTLRRGG